MGEIGLFRVRSAMKRHYWTGLIVLLVGLGLLALPDGLAKPGVRDAVPRQVTPRGPLLSDELATVGLFEQTRDSVVYITTSAQVRDFWSRDVFSVPRGSGSGVFWDGDGHIITNHHVIEGASEAKVTLADGSSYTAILVGSSPPHDLAVLRIGTGYKRPAPIPIGTSHDLRVGQNVYAIGNPFGLDWTLTSGLISALDRSLSGGRGASIEHLIQTDAAINPGNSGGPLLDSAGRLIGINTAIYSPSGASAGIGFAVPVDTVNRVVPQLIRQGRYIRPALGIEADEGINRRLTEILGIKGVVILRVSPQSAAARAGLRGVTVSRHGDVVPGDIITAIEGKPVDSLGRLVARLDDYSVGESIRVTVLRSGKTIDLRVTLQAGG
ncbi:MAG TPA: trypsin-like peptidase domain-containing protein [Rhodocyclaceae bacterium]